MTLFFKNVSIRHLFLILIFLCLLPLISPNVHAQELKYFESRDLRLIFNFYGEISEFDLFNYFYYYKAFYDDQNRIIKYEYYANDSMDSTGEYTWFDNDHCSLVIKKKTQNVANGQVVYKDVFRYEIILNNDRIEEYKLVKYSEYSGETVIGISKVSYINDYTIAIENYFGSIFVGKVVVYLKENEKVQERIYNSYNILVEIRIYKNNRLYQIKKYVYNSQNVLIRVDTYDKDGKLISSENK